ncbi:MAG: hypothetical protein UX62_C0051G0005 [Microgenomates group bacterium GW2011_GWA2_46_7]|nr:MAG: hypothetical protein UX62_C0051G0005 [Microgenomates group bacterium GW2011_GWA2_46_7]
MPDGKEVIEKNGQIFAHVIRKSYRPDGVNFLTPDAYTATIYDYGWNVIKEVVLNQGDILLQVSGGHGFDVLEPSYLIEIKQGPFPGDKLMKFYKEEPTVKS